MTKIFEQLNEAAEFLKRRPQMDGSLLLKTEAAALAKALKAYNLKAQEVELTLAPGYEDVLALVEGDAKKRLTADFMRDFTKNHCSATLSFSRVTKKERKTLLVQVARDGKLPELKRALDQESPHRARLFALLSSDDDTVAAQIMAMSAADFKGTVLATGIECPRTKSGEPSTSQSARKSVAVQVLKMKRTEDLMREVMVKDAGPHSEPHKSLTKKSSL